MIKIIFKIILFPITLIFWVIGKSFELIHETLN